MALSHTTKVFAVKAAKIYAVTADVVGSATTYATGIVVPAMREIIVTETWKEAYLRGDNTLVDYEAARDTLKATIRHGKLNMDAIAVITGATVADTGTTPSQKATTTYAAADRPGFFKIDAQCVAVDGMPTSSGDYHVILGKVKIGASRAFGLREEDFQEYQFEVVAIAPQGTGSVWYQEVLEETATAPA